MASIDQLIGGSFESLGLPRLSQSEQQQWLNTYAGANPALSAIRAATPSGNMAPASWNAYQGVAPVASSVGGSPMPDLPQSRPASAPTRIDTAAMGASPSISRVSGKMEQNNPLAGLFGGGLLSLLTGPSKNGLGGLAGLLGGPQQGGILQTLFGGGKSTAGLPRQPAAMTSAQRYAALNSGPGSVAAMERLHSGQSRNPQSGGPASGGEYASGGR